MVLYENLMFFDPDVKVTDELPEELPEWCFSTTVHQVNDNYANASIHRSYKTLI